MSSELDVVISRHLWWVWWLVYSRTFLKLILIFVYIKDQGILTLTWKPSIKEVFVVDGAGREDSGVGCWVM